MFSNVWTSPILSCDGYKYYVIFVDHYSKYIRFYPLKHKFDVLYVFKCIKSFVVKQFTRSIVTLYMTMMGNIWLSKHCFELMVFPIWPLHLTHPNIMVFRMQTWPPFPPYFGFTFAFASIVYPTNRMLKQNLTLKSSFECLFQTLPNYLKLRVLECLCCPWLRLYTSNKLESRSCPCVFLCYSLTQSAFMCYDCLSKKIYNISRHVVFVESEFPFKSSSLASVDVDTHSGL